MPKKISLFMCQIRTPPPPVLFHFELANASLGCGHVLLTVVAAAEVLEPAAVEIVVASEREEVNAVVVAEAAIVAEEWAEVAVNVAVVAGTKTAFRVNFFIIYSEIEK